MSRSTRANATTYDTKGPGDAPIDKAQVPSVSAFRPTASHERDVVGGRRQRSWPRHPRAGGPPESAHWRTTRSQCPAISRGDESELPRLSSAGVLGYSWFALWGGLSGSAAWDEVERLRETGRCATFPPRYPASREAAASSRSALRKTRDGRSNRAFSDGRDSGHRVTGSPVEQHVSDTAWAVMGRVPNACYRTPPTASPVSLKGILHRDTAPFVRDGLVGYRPGAPRRRGHWLASAAARTVFWCARHCLPRAALSNASLGMAGSLALEGSPLTHPHLPYDVDIVDDLREIPDVLTAMRDRTWDDDG